MSYDNIRIGEWILSSDINKPDNSFIDPNEEGKTFNVSDYPELAKIKTEWVNEDTITIPDNEIPIDKTVKNYYTMIMTAKTYAAGLYLAKNSYVHNAGIIYKVNQNLKTTNWADDSNYFIEIEAENYKYYAIYYATNIPLAKNSYVSYNGRFYKLNETIAKTTNWATDSLKMFEVLDYSSITKVDLTYDVGVQAFKDDYYFYNGRVYKLKNDIVLTTTWTVDSPNFGEITANDYKYFTFDYRSGTALIANSYVTYENKIYMVKTAITTTTNWETDVTKMVEVADLGTLTKFVLNYEVNILAFKDDYYFYNGRFYKLNETIARTTNWATDSLKMSQDPSFDEYKVKTNQTITYDGKRYKALEDISMTVNWSEDSSKFEEVEMDDLQYSIAVTGKKPYLRAKNLLSTPLSEKIFPVGHIYISMVDKNPGEYFGGTWIKITAGKFLINVDPDDEKINTSGKEGGLITKQLTIEEMPKHSHKFRHFKLQFPKDKPIADKIAGYDLKHFTFDNDVETDATGESKPFDIRPNYFACYMFQKIE